MRKLVLVIFTFFSFFSTCVFSQSDSLLSLQQIEEYELETRQLVKYLEGTLNFIGNPDELPSEKDIIFNQSYLKLFTNDEVQVEDDLDENRTKPLNKDIQAYLRDIDFFFKEVTFDFEIDTTDRIITDSNKIVFKVTINRHLSGITVDNDTIDNNQLRFIEINLDPYQKDLKIASIYTTKIREKEGLRNWWNEMSPEWKNYFGRSVIVYDTIPFKDIIWFSDTSLATYKWVNDTITEIIDNDSLAFDTISLATDTIQIAITDTIKVNSSTIYRILKTFRNIEFLDISNTMLIKELNPVSELSELKELNISSTPIKDLNPIRNLKGLVKLNCAGSEVTNLSPLIYLGSLKEIDLSYTAVENIEPLSGLKNLEEVKLNGSSIKEIGSVNMIQKLSNLDISHTSVSSLPPLKSLIHLTELNISSTLIDNLIGIDSVKNLQHLNIDSTSIKNIENLQSTETLMVLQANNTNISSLKPLQNKSELKIVYCDNTNINSQEANRFMDENPGVIVIYNSKELENWWNGLSSQWRLIFQQAYNISNPITVEKLHEIIQKRELSIAYKEQLSDISPLSMMHRLEKLDISHTSVSNINELSVLSNLEELNLNNLKVASLEPLSSLRKIVRISFENTDITSLSPLENSVPDFIYCDKSNVPDIEALSFKNKHSKSLIIYQSENLKLWWNSLSQDWKNVFQNIGNVPPLPSNENLQTLVDLETIVIKDNLNIADLYPLYMFKRLTGLAINSTSVSDITPVFDLKTIENLDISKNPVSQLVGISNLDKLNTLIVQNTSVDDLEPISQVTSLKHLDISGTKIKSLKYITRLVSLEKLFLNNTAVKSIKPIYELPELKLLQCFNTKIKASRIDQLKQSKPDLEIIFY